MLSSLQFPPIEYKVNGQRIFIVIPCPVMSAIMINCPILLWLRMKVLAEYGLKCLRYVFIYYKYLPGADPFIITSHFTN